jgi:DNA-binding NarL/FixJ family response regulator
LVRCLQADPRFAIVGSVDTALEGYQLVEEATPDVALVGTTLATAPGLVFAAELRCRYPAVAVVVVAADESDDELFAAIRAGASAYCGRDIGEELLYELVWRSANGEYVINEQLASASWRFCAKSAMG